MSSLEKPRPLSAKYKTDFAYPTVKDRLPVILTRVIDVIHRSKNDLSLTDVQQEDLKTIVSHLSKLKFELQTDKPLSLISDEGSDVEIWNKRFHEDQKSQVKSSWFQSAWLYVECYFYRRIKNAILYSEELKDLDPFRQQKCETLSVSLPAMNSLALHFLNYLDSKGEMKSDNRKDYFLQLIQVCLWGNKCDLSISAGADNPQLTNPIDQLQHLESSIISDDSGLIWNYLMDKGAGRVDIVLDNAGFELFTDLIFADFLVSAGLATEVHMHGKCFPWFVSDVTTFDFERTLLETEKCSYKSLQKLSEKWKKMIEAKSFAFELHDFWTSPYDFSEMQRISPDLYSSLKESNVIFFKGDLNYRKLISDLTWNLTMPFTTALQGFHPAPLCALRTLKCDCCVGLQPGVAEDKQKNNQDWMLNGSFGVIQFCSK